MEANSQKTIHTFKPIYPQITKINLYYQIWDIAANLKPKMTVSVTVWWGIKDIFVHCKDEELDLPSLYWIPKLHKCPFKQRYIAGSAKCSTKPLSKLLTCILSAVNTGLQSYCDTSYSRGGVNQMWILKNSKDLLEYIQSRSLSSCNSIKTFDFSTLYTTIPHSKLKDKLRELVQLCFMKKNGQRRYKNLVLGRDILFCKTPLILPKSSLRLISSTCSSFWLTTYWLCLVDVFFNRQSAYLWVQTVLLFSPTCSFIRMRQTSYRGFSRKTKRS
jgi:hypothetical protein